MLQWNKYAFLSRIRTFLVFIGLRFDSDFTQILLRYLSQKMTGKASAEGSTNKLLFLGLKKGFCFCSLPLCIEVCRIFRIWVKCCDLRIFPGTKYRIPGVGLVPGGLLHPMHLEMGVRATTLPGSKCQCTLPLWAPRLRWLQLQAPT